ncbi:MAG: hypothetical protein RIR94_1841, partial [Bacteroidota bacterium]
HGKEVEGTCVSVISLARLVRLLIEVNDDSETCKQEG